ncbi:hypothetical protein NUW54_g2311 [Trametes sanguinea]|uniref:Uncharacterized protein n=1 Tax=Trametes sanguinea TaxID=158606 RepID=A0ACC1Q452_9APHY|nr:hypothetical protein NUW54_g2311 [Trametes sanguinea]
MTSFIIKAHEGRSIPLEWKLDAGCAFCKIVRGEAPAHKMYETDTVIAILDIQPLRPGHTLVIPKIHIPRVSELPDEFAGECGKAVSRVARALATVLGNTALNVVCNQEYAQAVPHVHYHIIPAPKPSSEPVPVLKTDHVTKPLTQKEMHRLEFESRNDLDEEFARRLVDNPPIPRWSRQAASIFGVRQCETLTACVDVSVQLSPDDKLRTPDLRRMMQSTVSRRALQREAIKTRCRSPLPPLFQAAAEIKSVANMFGCGTSR